MINWRPGASCAYWLSWHVLSLLTGDGSAIQLQPCRRCWSAGAGGTPDRIPEDDPGTELTSRELDLW